MDSTPDFYRILGVPEHTNQNGIRKAYLQKAWECHPDVNAAVPESAPEMRDVNKAYATLSNPTLRADYDARRHAVFVTRGAPFLTTPRSSTSTHGLVGGPDIDHRHIDTRTITACSDWPRRRCAVSTASYPASRRPALPQIEATLPISAEVHRSSIAPHSLTSAP